eukprot:6103541-Pyramimonas_sp.AAC.1
MASATVSRVHRGEREDSREPQGEGQGEDRDNLADRSTQPTGNATLGNAQPPRLPWDSAMENRRRKGRGESGGTWRPPNATRW